jgi:hypothetical protein
MPNVPITVPNVEIYYYILNKNSYLSEVSGAGEGTRTPTP